MFKKYYIVPKALSYELANFGLNYFLMKREAVSWMLKNRQPYWFPKATWLLGNFIDKQLPNTYSVYGDFFMDTLLMKMLPIVQKYTKLALVPCYTWARVYKKGDELVRHKDRISCEVSCTLNLGGDPWPIFIEPSGKSGVAKTINLHTIKTKKKPPKGKSISLSVGDMMIYAGSYMEHWREPFKGNMCAQVSLHYVDADGRFAKSCSFDKRPMLGIPLGCKLYQ